MVIKKELADHLQTKPAGTKVHLNKEGEWLFYPKKGYKEYTREQLLKKEVEEESTESEKKEEKQGKKK